MSKNESSSKSKTAIWIAVVTGVFTLFGTIITVIVGPIIQQRLTTPTPPTPTQAVAAVTPDTPTATLIPPTNTPTLTPTPTRPPPAPALPPTPTATPTGTPTIACSFNPSGTFYGVWQAERSRLGCALNEVPVFTAEQPFERGFMFWREEEKPRQSQIYVLHSEGTWQVFPDTWTDDQPQYSCPDVAPSQSPPTPLCGFGKVWCERLGGPSAAIGWATFRQLGFPDDRWVDCEQGMMLWSEQWGIFVFYGDHTWQLSK